MSPTVGLLHEAGLKEGLKIGQEALKKSQAQMAKMLSEILKSVVENNVRMTTYGIS